MFSRISFKLALIIAIALVGMIVMAPIALTTIRGQMMTDRQAKTQQMIDIGHGILAHYQKLESDGKIDHFVSLRDVKRALERRLATKS